MGILAKPIVSYLLYGADTEPSEQLSEKNTRTLKVSYTFEDLKWPYPWLDFADKKLKMFSHWESLKVSFSSASLPKPSPTSLSKADKIANAWNGKESYNTSCSWYVHSGTL